ncbi:MAG: electron transport complex subunit RsxB [Pseudomonadota bacterium]
MLLTIAAVTLLTLILGTLLGFAALRFRVEGNPIADQAEKILPQTQCGQCGFAGCRPYAEALAQGETPVNLCVPGGPTVAVALAELLGQDPKTIGRLEEKPKAVAYIIETECIGCTLCLQACPVDAILGAAKQLHVVLKGVCTGCELCLPPCPVDCIRMVPTAGTLRTWRWPVPGTAASGSSPSSLFANRS